MNQVTNWDGSTKPINDLQRRAWEKMLVCYACKKKHFTGFNPVGYLWEARPGHHRGKGQHDWNVWMVTECGRAAHTEIVATFCGYLHDAEQNAKECAENHNRMVTQRADAARNFLSESSVLPLSSKVLKRIEDGAV
jgi:hypothetical protein